MITRRSLGLAAAALAALPDPGRTQTAGTLRVAFDAE